jgi:hypothetical protein
LSAAEIAVEAIAAAAAAFFTFGVSEVVFAAEVAANVICLALAAAATIEAAVSHFLDSLSQDASQVREFDIHEVTYGLWEIASYAPMAHMIMY